MRSCDDIDEQALSYAEIKALCAGDPRIREKMDLDVQVAKLKVLRGDFQNQKYRLEDKLLKTFPEEIQKQKTRIAALQQDSQIAAAHQQRKMTWCFLLLKQESNHAISGLKLFSFFLQMLLRYIGTLRLIHPARTTRRPLLHILLHQSFNFLFGELFDLNFHLYALLSILTA